MSHKLRRITMDWDFTSDIKFLWYLWKADLFLNNKKDEKLVIKRSKRGYHVFLWTRSYGDRLQIRAILGDDKKHIAMDRLHRYGRQTLFSKKTKLKNGGKQKNKQ